MAVTRFGVVFSLCFFFFSFSLCVIPEGFSTFFRGYSCPPGWQETIGSKGRLVVSVADGSLGGLIVGNPLNNMEDRTHTHNIVTSVTLDEHSVSASHCCNDQGACNGQYAVAGSTAPTSSEMPFVQLLLCSLVNETVGDIPYGTLAYFANGTAQSCEEMDGWTTLATATGRSLIPGYSTGLFTSISSPLKSQENRVHNHQYTASFTTDDVEYAGIGGCCNHRTAQDRVYTITDTTDEVSTDIPYIQLLTCVSETPTFNVDLPSNAYIFTQVSCPPGYRISEVLAGRFLVSLPYQGTPGAVFGGPSLPQGTLIGNNHSHPFSASFQTQSCGVGLASGCCAHGYVKNDKYIASGLTVDVDAHFPFLSIPICELDVGLL